MDEILNAQRTKQPSTFESLMGAATDPQFYRDMGSRVFDALSSGVRDVFPTGANPGSSLAQSGVPTDPQYREKILNLALAGQTVYHGSPHLFDKFDMSKIGTGEGAQAYGHGLYVAENPAVARNYAVGQLTAVPPAPILVDGKPIAADYAGGYATSTIGYDKAHETLSAIVEDARKAVPPKWAFRKGRENDLADIQQRLFDNLARHEKNLRELEAIKDQGLAPRPTAVMTEPNLYKADIPDEAVARMLDWDKPLSQQPEIALAIRKSLQGNKGFEGFSPETTGMSLYEQLQNRALSYDGNPLNEAFKKSGGNQQAVVSDYLRSTGIPGIRYADAMSRGTGAGTSNYVLFSDQLPRILERNAQPTGAVPWQPGEFR
jgi:hypothetical protein